MELKEDFQKVYNYAHPHIENINEDTLKKIVKDAYSALILIIDSDELELSQIRSLIESKDLSIEDGSKLALLKDIRLEYEATDDDTDYEMNKAWKKASKLLESSLDISLNWDADGYFYVRDRDFIYHCIKIKSKSDIFEAIASNLNINLESLVKKYEVAIIPSEKKEIVEDIINEATGKTGDLSVFFDFNNSTAISTLEYARYILKKALRDN